MNKSIVSAVIISVLITITIIVIVWKNNDVFSYEIPIANRLTIEDTDIFAWKFSKDSKRILLICNQSQDVSYRSIFDLDTNQIKEASYIRLKRYASTEYYDPNLEYSITLIPENYHENLRAYGDDVSNWPREIIFNNAVQPLGNPQPLGKQQPKSETPAIRKNEFKLMNLWKETELILYDTTNWKTTEFYNVGFDNIKSEIWVRDRKDGLGYRPWYWELHDNLSGKFIQKFPNALNGFDYGNILHAIPITSPDSSKVAFLAGIHYNVRPIGHEDNEVCFAMVCDRKTGDYIAEIPVDASCSSGLHFSAYYTQKYVQFANDSQSLFVRDSRWQISSVDIATQQILHIFNIRMMFPNYNTGIRMQKVTQDGCLIIESVPSHIYPRSDVPNYFIWDGKSGNVVQTYDSYDDFEHRDRVSPDGRTVLSLDRFEYELDEETWQRNEINITRLLTFKDAKTGEILATQEVPANGSIMPVEISNDWSKMAGYGKEKLIVYDISSIINRP